MMSDLNTSSSPSGDLGSSGNMGATGKQKSSGRAVAVCIETRDGPGRERLRGVVQYARRHAWRLMLVRTPHKIASREVLQLQPDGILAYVAQDSLIDAAKRLAVPIVDTVYALDSNLPFVAIDDDVVGRLAAEHLCGKGLEHFGFYGIRNQTATIRRKDGFADHLDRRGRKLYKFYQNVAEGQSRMAPLLRWLKSLPKPIGILANDDKNGERLLTACQWANLAVPEQVAVLGIGNDEVMCELCYPTLSSIMAPLAMVGFEAAAIIDRLMDKRTLKQLQKELTPNGIAVRGSTDFLFTQNTLVLSAIEIIKEELSCFQGIKNIARTLNVSRRTLDRHFLEALGHTVSDHVKTMQMHLAQDKLLNTSETIARIAISCGFESTTSFSRAFRHQTGRWPSHFRNEARIGIY